MEQVETVFASLARFSKGGVQVIEADPKHFAFSNVFEVASRAKPYEKVVVARNGKYVIEAIRAEGPSSWFAASHDEFVLVMDGELHVRLVKPEKTLVPRDKEGSVMLLDEPAGRKMGAVRARRGHLTLLPAGAAYQLRSERPSVLIMQTILGSHSVERWADICLK